MKHLLFIYLLVTYLLCVFLSVKQELSDTCIGAMSCHKRGLWMVKVLCVM